MIITPAATTSPEGKTILAGLQDRFQLADSKVQEIVSDILDAVRDRGDAALIEYTQKFDSPDFKPEQLKVSDQELADAYGLVDLPFMEALQLAIDRIRNFHEREKEQSWMVTEENGTITGRLVQPVEVAGLYVPGGQGGKTPLVSSVLMNGLPAAIAGVERRVMMTVPSADGSINPALLVAAQEIGITEIYKAGSAWAIGALAFGTESVPKVDVIVGPGNQFVTEAKRQVSGRVKIDMIAGPSEVLIIADQTANPAHIAADMLAQAEHDPQALSMLVTTSEEIAQQVVTELTEQLEQLNRQDIARTSLRQRGVILIADNLHQAMEIANQIAAEHLEIIVENPFNWLPKIKHAGAIFLGPHTPESAGDYMAGPNHVLPTMGTARFSSALGVETFIKKSSIISYSAEALQAHGEHIQQLANLEGLTAHARSVALRLRNK